MKKALLGILCAGILLFSAACNGSTENETVGEESSDEGMEVEEEPMLHEERVEDPGDDANLIDGQAETATEENLDDGTTGESDDKINVEPESVVLIDSEEYYVEFQGIDEYSENSWIVDLYVENKTDSEVYLTLSRGMVNGFMMNFANNSNKIDAGSKYMSSANHDYIIEVGDLQDYGIESMESLEFDVELKDSFLGDDIASASADIDMELNVPTNASETENTTNEILYDADGFYVEYRGVQKYSSQNLLIDLYIENNRDSDVWVSLDDGVANGYTISFSNSGETILAGAKYLSLPKFDFLIGIDDLEAYGIETLDTLTFNLSISTSMFGDKIGEADVNLEPNMEIE